MIYYEDLYKVRKILEDKENRIKDFENKVQQVCKPLEYSKEKHKIYELDTVLNPLSKELYIDIDEVITDKKRAKNLKEKIESGLYIEENSTIGKTYFADFGYYESSLEESYSGYPSVYFYLIPHYNNEAQKWNYEEKNLYLPEVINLYSRILNHIDKECSIENF